MDCGPPGSSVCGVSQARILERVAISFSGDLPDPVIEPMSPPHKQVLYHWATREAKTASTRTLLYSSSAFVVQLVSHKGRGKRESLPILYDCWASNVYFSKIILFDCWQLTLGKSNLIHYFILLKWILSAGLVEVSILIGDIIIFELKKEETFFYENTSWRLGSNLYFYKSAFFSCYAFILPPFIHSADVF